MKVANIDNMSEDELSDLIRSVTGGSSTPHPAMSDVGEFQHNQNAGGILHAQ